jgi:hypothetical protein
MAPEQAWKLFFSGWKFYVALWVLTFGLLILLAQGIPRAHPTSWVADAAPSLLDVLIPSDPFTALSRNYVRAVVVFCLFYGVALQYVPEKAPLLSGNRDVRANDLSTARIGPGIFQILRRRQAGANSCARLGKNRRRAAFQAKQKKRQD